LNDLIYELSRFRSQFSDFTSDFDAVMANNSNGIRGILNIISTNVMAARTGVETIVSRLGSESSSTGINYQIRNMLGVSSPINTSLQTVINRLGQENSTTGVNYQIRNMLGVSSPINTSLQTVIDRLGRENSTSGINYQIRNMLGANSPINTSLQTVIDRLGRENSTTGVNYQLRQILSALSNLKIDVVGGDTLQDIFNEAGTNFNDVLNTIAEKIGEAINSLVEALGNSLVAGIEELGKTMRAILDFLENLIELLMRLLVPEDINFVTNSFDDIKSEADNKIKPVTDFSNRFMDALNVNKQSERIAKSSSGGLFSQSLENSLRFTLLGTEVNFTPIDDVFEGVKKIRLALSIFVVGTTGFALKRRVRGKEGLSE